MYGSDSDQENAGRRDEGFVELKPEVVEFPTLHKREEELYFHDAFTYPWEKDKHYKMVYQLEKKYFPDQSLDKAFLQPGQSNINSANVDVNEDGRGGEGRKKVVGVDEKLVFFEGKEKGEEGERGSRELKEKKVEEFFKGLKKGPGSNKDVLVGEPFLSSRRTGLPPVWDSPHGTVVLVNKPKGQLHITHYIHSFLCFTMKLELLVHYEMHVVKCMQVLLWAEEKLLHGFGLSEEEIIIYLKLP